VAIVELLDSGGLVSLDRLRGSTNPEKLLQTVPMTGPKLAHLIHDRLHIDTLEGLEAAAIDGSLANINGYSKCRINSVRHSLNDMLARRRPIHSNRALTVPSVIDVLAVDQEYR
jgi:DNA polymerase/3'-5' exonuclease PolX